MRAQMNLRRPRVHGGRRDRRGGPGAERRPGPDALRHGLQRGRAVPRALFAGYKKVTPTSSSSTRPNGGNAGVKDVQHGTQPVRRSTASAAPQRRGHDLLKLFLDGLCIDVNPANTLSNIDDPAGSPTSSAATYQLERGPRLEPEHDDRPGRPRHQRRHLQLLPEAVLNGDTQSSNVNPLRRTAWSPTRSPRTRTRSATSASPGRAAASRR